MSEAGKIMPFPAWVGALATIATVGTLPLLCIALAESTARRLGFVLEGGWAMAAVAAAFVLAVVATVVTVRRMRGRAA